jgi:molybdenum cofactor biosynthesis protein B
MGISMTDPIPSYQQHRDQAPDVVRFAVLTVSDTRTKESDTSGALIIQMLADKGHENRGYLIVPDEPDQIRGTLERWSSNVSIDCILSNGGTGIAKRDTTYDVISSLLEKKLDGFGELFRQLSFQEIGPAAMLSRAVAGTYRGKLIMAMPGSTNAVRLAMEQLIAPEIAHLVFELNK